MTRKQSLAQFYRTNCSQKIIPIFLFSSTLPLLFSCDLNNVICHTFVILQQKENYVIIPNHVFTFQRHAACIQHFVRHLQRIAAFFTFLPSLEQNDALISDVLLYHRMALLLSPNNSGMESWLCSCYQVGVWCVRMKRIYRCLLDALINILPEAASLSPLNLVFTPHTRWRSVAPYSML